MRDYLFVLKVVLVCATTFFCTPATAQSPSELALKNLQRQKWQRSYSLLQKSLAKDSLNVTAKYVLAQYFFLEENPAHHLDSAYLFAKASLEGFESLSMKQRERLRRFPLDSGKIAALLKKIDSVGFKQAKAIHTEKGYIDYLERFAPSYSLLEATALRDSVAYQIAVAENKYQSFERFLQKYPESKQYEAASKAYEKLLLASKTSDQKLESYEAFLREHPNTIYRTLVEQTIFEYRTASGNPQQFIDFIRDNPKNIFVKRAKNILYHLIPTSERAVGWPADFTSDSLIKVTTLEPEYLVPFLKNGMFGFMDSNAQEIIESDIDSLNHRYTCGNIDDDIILLPKKIISKSGTVIWKGSIDDVEDIGAGFLLIVAGDCKSVLHKSGFRVGNTCVQDAKVLNRKLLAIQAANMRWSVWSFAGKLLLDNVDEVFSIKDVVCVKSNQAAKLFTVSSFENFPHTPEVRGTTQFYDEVKHWNNDLVWVKKNEQVGLLKQSLEAFLEPALQSLYPAAGGVVATDSSGSKLYLYNGHTSETHAKIISRFDWYAAKDSLWYFLDSKTLAKTSIMYDSISFSGPFAIASRRDSIHVFFTSSKVWKGKDKMLNFVPGGDSTSFLAIAQGAHKILYNQKGERMFSLQADNIQHAGNDLFIIQQSDKKGLVTAKGRIMLPVQYDAISSVNNGQVSLLKSGRFGLFDCTRKKQIPCSYDKNLLPYNHQYIVATKNGASGFIGWDNKSVGKFEFNEIQFWNDTTALVRKNTDWMLYEIKTREVLMNNIKQVTRIRDKQNDQLAIVYKDGNHGVIHSQNGTIIPIAFNDLVNVGSAEKPFYFSAQKSADENFIVTYFNDRGEIVRQETYSQEDYDRIFCNG